jgi:hypothetical protein
MFENIPLIQKYFLQKFGILAPTLANVFFNAKFSQNQKN